MCALTLRNACVCKHMRACVYASGMRVHVHVGKGVGMSVGIKLGRMSMSVGTKLGRSV